MLGIGKQFPSGPSNAETFVSISRPNCAASPVVSVRTGLILQAPERGPDPGGSVRFNRSAGGEGRGGLGREEGGSSAGGGGGQGAVRGSCVRRGPVFAPSLTSKLNQDCSATFPVDVYVG